MIQEIEGKMITTWNEEAKAVVDTWTNYYISLEEFKEAVLVKGLNYAKAHGGIAWIVDSSQAKGAFKQEIQEFITTDIFPAFVKNGIKYFITVTSNVSAITQLVVTSYSVKAEAANLKLIEAQSVEEAVEWLKTNG